MIRHARPLASDHHEQYAGRRYGAGDDLDEIVAGLNAVDVDENLIFAELRGKAVVEPPRVRSRVLAAVAHKDVRHERLSAVHGRAGRARINAGVRGPGESPAR